MATVKIKRASLNNLEQIYALVTSLPVFSASDETRFFDKKELKEWIIRKRDSIVLIAELNDLIVGFLFAKLVSSEWCMLDSIGVNPKFRKQGIANKLLEQLYQLLKKRNVTYIQGLVEVNQKSTREFWKKRGFKEGNKFVWIEKRL